ncbi:twin-arginine translocase TatA/TatE family subunit [Streptomyces sp. NPDC002809]|uniref:twin-arginine translocase TatA/TatE family subunit n=1 Tax=Streptomyces sp. NPDC002809 TaxID=3154433 RepID=UPI00331DBC7C
MFGISEMGVVLVVVVLVLSVKKLPELLRSAGRSARILKAEARSLKDQDTRDTSSPPAPRVIIGETVPPRNDQGTRRQ